MLIWTNLCTFAITYRVLSILLHKFHFPVEIVLNFLQTQNGLDYFSGRRFCRIFQ